MLVCEKLRVLRIVVGIASEGVSDRPEYAVEVVLVDGEDLAALFARDDARASGDVAQQGEFAKVRARRVVDLDLEGALGAVDECGGGPPKEDEELVSEVSLLHERLPRYEILLIEDFRQLRDLVPVEFGQNGDLLQERLDLLLATRPGRRQQQLKRRPVQGPQSAGHPKAHIR